MHITEASDWSSRLSTAIRLLSREAIPVDRFLTYSFAVEAFLNNFSRSIPHKGIIFPPGADREGRVNDTRVTQAVRLLPSHFHVISRY